MSWMREVKSQKREALYSERAIYSYIVSAYCWHRVCEEALYERMVRATSVRRHAEQTSAFPNAGTS